MINKKSQKAVFKSRIGQRNYEEFKRDFTQIAHCIDIQSTENCHLKDIFRYCQNFNDKMKGKLTLTHGGQMWRWFNPKVKSSKNIWTLKISPHLSYASQQIGLLDLLSKVDSVQYRWPAEIGRIGALLSRFGYSLTIKIGDNQVVIPLDFAFVQFEEFLRRHTLEAEGARQWFQENIVDNKNRNNINQLIVITLNTEGNASLFYKHFSRQLYIIPKDTARLEKQKNIISAMNERLRVFSWKFEPILNFRRKNLELPNVFTFEKYGIRIIPIESSAILEDSSEIDQTLHPW
jgi:hypothetical protein